MEDNKNNEDNEDNEDSENIEDNENNENNEDDENIDISENNIESHIQTIFNSIINNNNSLPPFLEASRSRDTIIRNYLTQEMFRNPMANDSSIADTFTHIGNIRPSNLSTVLEQSFNEESVFKDVIDDDEFLTLRPIKYKDSNKNNNTCPILVCDFEEDDDIIELPCKHVYNPNAIEKWLKEESNVCPVCRYQFKSKEIKKEEEEESTSTDSYPETAANNSNYFHNPIQRYLIERIINTEPNNINTGPPNFFFDSTEIAEDDSDFQQAIINSMSQSSSITHSDNHDDT